MNVKFSRKKIYRVHYNNDFTTIKPTNVIGRYAPSAIPSNQNTTDEFVNY